MISNAKTVAQYLESLPDDRRAALKRVRTLVKKSLAGAKETMDYGMPSYIYKGCPVFAFASQAGHMSLYLCDTKVLTEYKKKLGKLSMGKSCIRFRKLEDLPLEVTAAMLAKAGKRAKSGEFVYKGHGK